MLRRTVLASLTLLFVAALAAELVAQGKGGGGGGGGGGGTTPPPADAAIVFTEDSSSKGKPVRNLRVMNADGSNVRTVLSRGATGDRIDAPCWSPDATQIAFVGNLSGLQGLWRINVDGSGLTRLVAYPIGSVYFYGNVDWSPGNTPGGANRIAFTRPIEGTDYDELWVVNPDGSGLQLLTSSLMCFGGVAWTLDGSRLVVSDALDLNVLYLAADTLGNLTITNTNFVYAYPYCASSPRAANTGDRILFSDRLSHPGTLDLSVSPPVLTLLNVGCGMEPSFSPDDSRLALRCNGEIYTCAPDGSNLTLIHSGGFCKEPNWRR